MEKSPIFAVMLKQGVESANIHLDPCSCRLVGLVMVFWLLGLWIFVCDLGWMEGVAICINWVAVLVPNRDEGCVYIVYGLRYCFLIGFFGFGRCLVMLRGSLQVCDQECGLGEDVRCCIGRNEEASVPCCGVGFVCINWHFLSF